MTDNLGDLLDKLANAVQEHATVMDKAVDRELIRRNLTMLERQLEESVNRDPS